MKLRILIAGLLIGVAAFTAEAGGDLFQKATTLVRAGNLEEAIKLYRRVAKEFASDRALAAKALVAEAKCYETLGQDKATKLYEQVAREYHDQPDQAAAATARLVVLRQGEHPATPATMAQRKIELPAGVTGTRVNTTDGQRVVFKDSATGALTISDLAGNGKRVVFRQPKDRVVYYWYPSRDFSLVLMRLTKPDKSSTYALVRADGTGYREIAEDSGAIGVHSGDRLGQPFRSSLPAPARGPSPTRAGFAGRWQNPQNSGSRRRQLEGFAGRPLHLP